MSCALALVGALFFIAYRLATIRDGEIVAEPFSLGDFWGGVFVRCAKAILLVFALFLILIGTSGSNDSATKWGLFPLAMLPAIGQLGGMLIKSFEQVVFGLADRLFKVVGVLLPTDRATTNSPARPVVPPRRCNYPCVNSTRSLMII